MKQLHSNRIRTTLVVAILISCLLHSNLLTHAQGGNQAPSISNYELLIMGDSVIWGQGLLVQQKYTRLVAAKIQDHYRDRIINIEDVSHSGATIVANPRFKVPDNYFESLHGEVPRPTPTLWAQLTSAMRKYNCQKPTTASGSPVCDKSPDLIVLNGGINDLGIDRLVNPFFCNWTIERSFKRQVHKYCYTEMKAFLREVSRVFPNSWVFVTGYYPIICNGTRDNVIKTLISSIVSPASPDAAKDSEKELLQAQKKVEQKQQKVNNSPEKYLIKRLSKLSRIWKTESDKSLQESVDDVNNERRSQKIMFAGIDFGEDECYGGTNTKLWEISGFEADYGVTSNDLQKSVRVFACPEARIAYSKAEIDPFFKLMLNGICPPAGTGHPNVEGSRKYADAIWVRLEPLLK